MFFKQATKLHLCLEGWESHDSLQNGSSKFEHLFLSFLLCSFLFWTNIWTKVNWFNFKLLYSVCVVAHICFALTNTFSPYSFRATQCFSTHTFGKYQCGYRILKHTYTQIHMKSHKLRSKLLDSKSKQQISFCYENNNKIAYLKFKPIKPILDQPNISIRTH